MLKKITNSWDWQEPSSKMVTYGRQHMCKEGSWYKKYQPKKDSIFVLTLALGAGEAYGPNRNGDFFSEEELQKRHNTFVDNGKHYKHHANDDPENSYGDVVDSHYNPKMKRVELIVRIEKNKKENKDIIERVEQGVPVPVSMAARVPHDICSICGNKAKVIKNYCGHLKNEMLDIKNDGRLVFAINPDPTFFDISEVVVGADPTAHTLKKVASLAVNTMNFLQKSIDIKKYGSYNDIYLKKVSILERLAAIEKKIDGVLLENLGSKLSNKKLPKPTKLAEYISSMAKNGLALKVSEYNPLTKQGTGDVRYMYRSLLKHPDIINRIPLVKKGSCLLDNYNSRSLHNVPLEKQATVSFPTFSCDYSDMLKVAAINVAAYNNNNSSIYDYLLVLQNYNGV